MKRYSILALVTSALTMGCASIPAKVAQRPLHGKLNPTGVWELVSAQPDDKGKRPSYTAAPEKNVVGEAQTYVFWSSPSEIFDSRTNTWVPPPAPDFKKPFPSDFVQRVATAVEDDGALYAASSGTFLVILEKTVEGYEAILASNQKRLGYEKAKSVGNTDGFTGNFEVSGLNHDGSPYTCTGRIVRDAQGLHHALWKMRNGSVFEAIGLEDQGKLILLRGSTTYVSSGEVASFGNSKLIETTVSSRNLTGSLWLLRPSGPGGATLKGRRLSLSTSAALAVDELELARTGDL